MSTHTPGPWIKDIFAIYADSGRGEIARERSSGRSVAERTSNARLIAAAPELLAAMEDAYPYVNFWCQREMTMPSNSQELQRQAEDVLLKYKAAIRKAKGEL